MEDMAKQLWSLEAVLWASVRLAAVLLGSCVTVQHIEIDTLEYQQTEKIETELEDVDRIRIRKVYACCPGWHSGGS
jgi:hypothetical protein